MKFKKVYMGCVLLFAMALLTRVMFYILSLKYLPSNFLKFVNADTVFYYDPLALKMALHGSVDVSLLSITRCIFLGYLALFYYFFGHQHWPVIIFHCFIGATSVVLLYLSSKQFLNDAVAFTVGLVAVFQVVLVYWSLFVTTEPFFLLILSLCLFFFSRFTKSHKLLYAFLLAACLILTALIRPSGAMLLVFVFIYFWWLLFKKIFQRRAFVFYCIANIFILIGMLALVNNSAQKIDRVLLQPYSQGILRSALYFDQLPNAAQNMNYIKADWARLNVPFGIGIPKVNKVPDKILTADILQYFKNHTDKYLVLAVSRAYTLFCPWVPEYSFKHNILNSIYYGFIYIFCLMGIIELWIVRRNFAVMILIILGSQVFLVSLTLVDYDFRYRLPIELILAIPAGVGISRALVKGGVLKSDA